MHVSITGSESINEHPLIIEDCTVVYARSKFLHDGGHVFNMRGNGQGSGGYTISFRNIVVEDPRPTHEAFKILMEVENKDKRRGPGDLYGITFQNISIAAHSVVGGLETLWGMSDGLIYGLVFDNVTIDSDIIDNGDYFLHNEYVFE